MAVHTVLQRFMNKIKIKCIFKKKNKNKTRRTVQMYCAPDRVKGRGPVRTVTGLVVAVVLQTMGDGVDAEGQGTPGAEIWQ